MKNLFTALKFCRKLGIGILIDICKKISFGIYWPKSPYYLHITAIHIEYTHTHCNMMEYQYSYRNCCYYKLLCDMVLCDEILRFWKFVTILWFSRHLGFFEKLLMFWIFWQIEGWFQRESCRKLCKECLGSCWSKVMLVVWAAAS